MKISVFSDIDHAYTASFFTTQTMLSDQYGTDDYRNNRHDTYRITCPPEATYIIVRVMEFRLEGMTYNKCQDDYLQIFKGING